MTKPYIYHDTGNNPCVTCNRRLSKNIVCPDCEQTYCPKDFEAHKKMKYGCQKKREA